MLKTDIIYKLRNGHKCILLRNTNDEWALFRLSEDKKDLINVIYENQYNEDMTSKHGLIGFDIVAYKKYISHVVIKFQQDFLTEKEIEWDWDRNKPIEMTIEEIEQKLGHKIKIKSNT